MRLRDPQRENRRFRVSALRLTNLSQVVKGNLGALYSNIRLGCFIWSDQPAGVLQSKEDNLLELFSSDKET